MKQLLITLSLFLFTSPLFGQSEKPLTIVIPTAGLGDISNLGCGIRELRKMIGGLVEKLVKEINYK